MQKLSSQLIGQSVFSVHTAGKIGQINGLLVRQKDLKIELLKIELETSSKSKYLLPQDIRFEDNQKIIIDSHQNLSEPNELLRHQEIIKHPFTIIGCKVITQSGKKLGRVKDFSTETQHFFVTKLLVRASVGLWLISRQFVIDRVDIVDIEKNKITVKDSVVKSSQSITKPLPATK